MNSLTDKSVTADRISIAERPGSNPILGYYRTLLRRKWIVVGVVFATLVVAGIVTLVATKQYTAKATVEIARVADQVVDIKSVDKENNVGDLEFYQTQYGLLKSATLAQRVARDLSFADDPAFFRMFGHAKTSALAGNDKAALMRIDRPARIREAGDILLKIVQIVPVRLSRLVEIQATTPDPRLSAKIANAWGQQFINSTLERRFDATSYARNFLEERLEQLRRKLEESERALVGYASSERIINLPASQTSAGPVPERSLTADELSALNMELATATADMIRARSRLTGSDSLSEEALRQGAIPALRQKRAEVAAEYAQLLVKFEPGYPAAQALKSERDQLDASIRQEEGRVAQSVNGQYRASLNRVNALTQRVDSLKSGFLDLRRRSIQYNIYQREVDTNRALYDGLLQRYKEVGIAGGVGTNNVSVVDDAEIPLRPSKPNLFLNLALAFIIGTVAGIAAALVVEQLDETVSDPRELSEYLNVPLLGTVPKASEAFTPALLDDRKSEVSEAYLSIRTNLEFSTDKGVPSTTMVTSTRPAEGKSTTAFALANSLARSNRRVLLIDGDMRSPSVHRLFGVTNDLGLSNALSGSDNITPLIHQTDGGVAFMTAGPQPPNAADLLIGGRLELVLNRLLEKFDVIIIDAPPVMGLADAPLIASCVRGAIFAVEAHGTRRATVKVAVDRLRSANAHLLGVVLTKFQAQRGVGYAYEYGYDYGSKSRPEGT